MVVNASDHSMGMNISAVYLADMRICHTNDKTDDICCSKFGGLTKLPLDKMATVSQTILCIFMNDKSCVFIRVSLYFVPKGPIDNNPALV